MTSEVVGLVSALVGLAAAIVGLVQVIRGRQQGAELRAMQSDRSSFEVGSSQERVSTPHRPDMPVSAASPTPAERSRKVEKRTELGQRYVMVASYLPS